MVERTVEENSEVLKERNLGVEIFGRPADYDTNADPIVRVTAGEVRKRIAQYYQASGHEDELRIELPLGSYVPHFYPSHHTAPPLEHGAEAEHTGRPALAENEHVALAEKEPPATEKSELAPASAPDPVKAPNPARSPTRGTMRWRLGLAACSALVLLVGIYALVARGRSGNAGIRYFWQSFSPAGNEALVVLGVHCADSLGKAVSTESHVSIARDSHQSALSLMENSDMVPLSDIVSYSKVTDLLTRRSLAYRTKSSADTTLEELRTGPVVLIGGFNNVWTMRLTSALRYRLVPKGQNINAIEDSKNPSNAWLFDNLQPAVSNSRDYAVVASYYDPTIEQHVVIAAGIGMNGTMAAAEFLTTDRYLEKWLAEAHLARSKNVELVLSTDVLDGEPGPPHVIASAVW